MKMTKLERLERELIEAKRLEENGNWTYSGSYYAHLQYIQSLINQINKEKGIKNE